MKKSLLSLSFLFAGTCSWAFNPVQYVQISTNTLNPQAGGVNISTQSVNPSTITYLNIGVLASTTSAVGTLTNSCGYILGSIVQVSQFTNFSSSSTTGSTAINSHLSGTITPKCSSDKIVIQALTTSLNSASSGSSEFDIARNGSNLGTLATYTSAGVRSPIHISYLDSPSSISSLTYTLQFLATAGITVTVNDLTETDIMILEEIAQ